MGPFYKNLSEYYFRMLAIMSRMIRNHPHILCRYATKVDSYVDNLFEL
jgi:hypothetical protein